VPEATSNQVYINMGRFRGLQSLDHNVCFVVLSSSLCWGQGLSWWRWTRTDQI